MPDQPTYLTPGETLYPRATRSLRHASGAAQLVGLAAVMLRHGLREMPTALSSAVVVLILLAMLMPPVTVGVRYVWSRFRSSMRWQMKLELGFAAVWILGLIVLGFFGPDLGIWSAEEFAWGPAALLWTEAVIVVRGTVELVFLTRSAAAARLDPAMLLVLSFLLLITVGTLLLMLPRARSNSEGTQGRGAPFLVALFTSASASCVTGLVVEHTGTYWSRFGQIVILCLFQIGGLGIMTFGSFFAAAVGRRMQFRESANMRALLESERVGDVGRLLKAIVLFTFASELIGAVLISGLWAGLPWSERAYFSLFHAVSSFCNAGFALTENSFVGLGTRWEVWGVMSALIITGGIGFTVLYNVLMVVKSRAHVLERPPLFSLPRTRVRLTLTSKLVLVTTALLLIGGTLGIYLLEWLGSTARTGPGERIADAWFQSVIFRTAGFNSVEHGELHPATKLFAITLMFIGASPGSTGGGVKTVCVALMVLAPLSVLRGRGRVEAFGRTIPGVQVNRALTIISLALLTLMISALLLVVLEDNPDRLIDYLFEAASAFGTVGASAGVTADLTAASKVVLIVTMFLGRLGPLTLMLALLGTSSAVPYEYPDERVTLG